MRHSLLEDLNFSVGSLGYLQHPFLDQLSEDVLKEGFNWQMTPLLAYSGTLGKLRLLTTVCNLPLLYQIRVD